MRSAHSGGAKRCPAAEKAHPVPSQPLDLADMEKIRDILSNTDISIPARVSTLLRTKGLVSKLGLSPGARLVYLLIAHSFSYNGKGSDWVSLPIDKIADWAGCSNRNAQRHVRELTRSTLLPWLLQIPGKPGRSSKYTFVRDPVAVAEEQERQREPTTARRQWTVIEKQRAARDAEGRGEILPIESLRRQKKAREIRNWAQPTRPKLPSAEVPIARKARHR